MICVKVNLIEFEIIKKLFKCKNFEQSEVIINLYLTSNEVIEIIDLLSILFVNKGLKENYEPNNFGIIVENLIDKFTNLKTNA